MQRYLFSEAAIKTTLFYHHLAALNQLGSDLETRSSYASASALTTTARITGVPPTPQPGSAQRGTRSSQPRQQHEGALRLPRPRRTRRQKGRHPAGRAGHVPQPHSAARGCPPPPPPRGCGRPLPLSTGVPQGPPRPGSRPLTAPTCRPAAALPASAAPRSACPCGLPRGGAAWRGRPRGRAGRGGGRSLSGGGGAGPQAAAGGGRPREPSAARPRYGASRGSSGGGGSGGGAGGRAPLAAVSGRPLTGAGSSRRPLTGAVRRRGG